MNQFLVKFVVAAIITLVIYGIYQLIQGRTIRRIVEHNIQRTYFMYLSRLADKWTGRMCKAAGGKVQEQICSAVISSIIMDYVFQGHFVVDEIDAYVAKNFKGMVNAAIDETRKVEEAKAAAKANNQKKSENNIQ